MSGSRALSSPAGASEGREVGRAAGDFGGRRRVAVLPGDGIGAEVVAGPVELLKDMAAAGRIELTGPWPAGASAFGACGAGLPPHTLEACDSADALFLGAIGEHPGVPLADFRPERAIIGLRERFDLRVSIRPVHRVGAAGGRPLIVLRNLLGGAYGKAETRTESMGASAAADRLVLTPDQISELAELACDMVQRGLAARVISVDKANLLATSRLWRSITGEVAARRGVETTHTYVDRMAYELARDDVVGDAVILTEGIFGDILSDLIAGRAGTIALVGSASVNPGRPARGRCVGLFEPSHGSAPRHAGAGRVNPSGAYLALVSMLEWFPETFDLAPAVSAALSDVLRTGPWTYDLAPLGSEAVGTESFAAAVNERARPLLAERL